MEEANHIIFPGSVTTVYSNFFPKMGNKGMRCMLFRREMQEKANFAKK